MTQSKSFDCDAFAYYRHLASARLFVETNRFRVITLVDVASAIGVSPSRLSHLFQEKLGISFTEWLTHYRIERAIELMRLQDTSIAELAYSTGFGSYRAFHRSFKKVTGTTPSEFKKNQQEQHSTHFRQNATDT